MNPYNLTDTEAIIKQIEQADEMALEQMIRAVIRRYSALRTDRELSILSLPTDSKSRDAELENIIVFIRSCYRQQDPQ